MRPKAFKGRQPPGWGDDYAKPSDVWGGFEAVGALVRLYRARLAQHVDRPMRDEVRETLRRLSRMPQAEAAPRWSNLDASVRAEITAAALQQFRREHGAEVVYAPGLPFQMHGPDNLPELAALALENMGRINAGRPSITRLHVDFAADLATYWHETLHLRPTIKGADYDPSEFQQWAAACFEEVGFPTLGDFRTTLRSGVKAARDTRRIPE